MASRLDILVLLREVRDPRPPARLAATGVAIQDAGVRRLVNPADLSALEAAVALANERGGTVTALAVGNERLEDALRLARAMGAGRAIRIWDDAIRDGDAVAEARVLARVLEILRPSLFFTGSRLLDRGDEPSAALAAATAGWPCASAALSFDLAPGERAEVVRKAEKGGRQRVLLRLPCAVLFDAGAAEPREPDLEAVLRSLESEIEEWGVADLELPIRELGFAGALLRPAGVRLPRPDPLRLATPDPSLPGHERVKALFSGGIRPREGRMHFGSARETVDRILSLFADEGLLPARPGAAR
jgi:electron transfer flavoprotein beta subunit